MTRSAASARSAACLAYAVAGARRDWLFFAAWSISSGVISTVALTSTGPAGISSKRNRRSTRVVWEIGNRKDVDFTKCKIKSLQLSADRGKKLFYALAALGAPFLRKTFCSFLGCVFRPKSAPIPLANRHSFRSKSALVPTQIGTPV